MFRALLYLIVTIVMIGVIRGVVGLLSSLFTSATVAPSSRNTAGKRDPLKPEALQKDPVCGTFVAPSAAVSKEIGGQTLYFCSPACRDKFV